MEVRIKVGASVDASLRTAFRPLVQSAIEARRLILKEFAQVPKEIVALLSGVSRAKGGSFGGANAEARAAFREQSQLARAAAKEQAAIARQSEKVSEALERERVAAAKRANREIVQEYRATIREKEKEERKVARAASVISRRQAVELDRFSSRTSYHAARFLTPHMPILSIARRAGSEIMRGLGVDPTLSGAFQRNVQLQSIATNATNQARMAGQDVSPSAFESRVREVSTKRGMSREDTGAGLGRFQALTGDLQLGMGLLDKMAERAAATDARFEDMAATAANVSNALGDIPNKETAILDIIDQTIAQGARGAVEMKDLASHMARVTAAAGKFGGDKAHNIKLAGALVQIARAEGGAPSAAEAARSIVGFSNTFQKSARLKAFESITGKSAFTDSTHRELRGMDTLIKEALTATGGDRQKMNSIFMDVVGGRTVEGLTKAFNSKGGGKAGLAAVDQKIENFMGAPKDFQGQLDLANARRQQTDAFRAQRFQNQLDDVAQKVQSSLMPALEKLAPIIIQVAEALGGLATVALENPGMAIVAAIVASIARAGLESALRAALERGIKGAAEGAGGGGRFMGGVAAAGVGLGIGVPLAGAIYTGGVTAASANLADVDRSAREAFEFQSLAKNPGKVSAKKREELRRNITSREMQLGELQANRYSGLGGALDYIGGSKILSTLALGPAGSFLMNGNMTGRSDQIKQIENDLKRKRTAMDQIAAVAPDATEEVSKFVAKDPSKTSVEDMKAAFARGGVEELSKIATKQENVAQKMLDGQQKTNELLERIEKKVGKPGDADKDPNVDQNAPGFEG